MWLCGGLDIARLQHRIHYSNRLLNLPTRSKRAWKWAPQDLIIQITLPSRFESKRPEKTCHLLPDENLWSLLLFLWLCGWRIDLSQFTLTSNSKAPEGGRERILWREREREEPKSPRAGMFGPLRYHISPSRQGHHEAAEEISFLPLLLRPCVWVECVVRLWPLREVAERSEVVRPNGSS